MSEIIFETAAQVAASREDTDENWKTCRDCHCYSFRHELKTQSLTGLAGDARLAGVIRCKNCGKECQKVKQNLVQAPSHVAENKRLTQFRSMLERGF